MANPTWTLSSQLRERIERKEIKDGRCWIVARLQAYTSNQSTITWHQYQQKEAIISTAAKEETTSSLPIRHGRWWLRLFFPLWCEREPLSWRTFIGSSEKWILVFMWLWIWLCLERWFGLVSFLLSIAEIFDSPVNSPPRVEKQREEEKNNKARAKQEDCCVDGFVLPLFIDLLCIHLMSKSIEKQPTRIFYSLFFGTWRETAHVALNHVKITVA